MRLSSSSGWLLVLAVLSAPLLAQSPEPEPSPEPRSPSRKVRIPPRSRPFRHSDSWRGS